MIHSFIESQSVHDQLVQVVWVLYYWSEELLFLSTKCLFCSKWKLRNLCILQSVSYYGAFAQIAKTHRKRLVRHKLAAFLPIVYFTWRNCLLKNVIFLDAYYFIKYYSNAILQCTNSLFFLHKSWLCIGIICRDAIVILSWSRRPEDWDHREVVCFPTTVLYVITINPLFQYI